MTTPHSTGRSPAPSPLLCNSVLLAVVLLLTPAPTHAACGCSDIEVSYSNTIDNTGRSEVFCVDSGASFSECTEQNPNPCGAGKKGWKCPIGGAYGNDGDPWIGIGFQAKTTFAGGTTLSDCLFGQGIQRTIKVDGNTLGNSASGHGSPVGTVDYGTVTNRLYSSTGTAIPTVGTTDAQGRMKFAADNYSAVSPDQTIKQSGSSIIFWSDLPAVYVDGDTAKKVEVEDRILVFVRNANDTTVHCACRFTLTGVKNAGGDSLSSAALSRETSTSCTWNELQ